MGLKGHLNHLVQKGTQHTESDFEKGKISLLNQVCLLGIGVFIPFSIINGYLIDPILYWLVLIVPILYTIPYLNDLGYLKFSKVFIWTLVHVNMTIAGSFLGEGTIVLLSFLYTVWLIPLISNKSEIGLRIYLTGFSIGCIAFLEITNYSFFVVEAPTASTIQVHNYLHIGLTFIAALSSAYYFSNIYEAKNNDLQEILGQQEAQNKELEEANREAKRLSQAKTLFLANMSHEIRTPMNGVIGMTDLLLNTEMEAEQREYLGIIKSSGENLLTIINDILDFTKIESGKVELEQREFLIRNCVADALDLLAGKAHEKGIELLSLVQDDVPEVIIGDSTRINQILINLTNNALKFTEEGEVFVEVNKTSKSLSNGKVELQFSISDTGIGIPQDKVHQLFHAFEQADASTTRKYGGTGLGLAISRRLSELMNGEIWVESVLGEGSTFSFTIQVPIGTNALNTSPTFHGNAEILIDKKVLIVDDNPTNRLILELQADKFKMIPFIAASAKEALNLLQSGEAIDLCILDFQMPEMDGHKLGKIIHERYGLPMIMLSSALLASRQELEAKALFNTYLMKPFRQSHLIRAMTSVFQEKKFQTSPAKTTSKSSTINTGLAAKIPLRILVAEDNLVNQKVVRKVLGKMGYEIDIAADGVQTLEMLEVSNYDLIFMDLQMPKMGGLEATERIIQKWGTERPIIIAMTANAMQGDREMCLDAGMDDYISKPIVPAAIEKAIEKWGDSSIQRARSTTE